MTKRTQFYTILSAYTEEPAPSIGGGYQEDSRIHPDFTRVSSFDEDMPTGVITVGCQDETLVDLLPNLECYTTRSAKSLKLVVDRHYQVTDNFGRTPKGSLETFLILQNVLDDIQSEPTVMEAIGWQL